MTKRARVALIDDDKWLGEQFARTLEKAGYDVDLAHNGLEGMDAINAHMPRAIILDMFMPGPNGVVLLHELRSHSDLAKVPVIVCTNSASDLVLDELRYYGVKVLLDKTTMQPNDLVAAVGKVLL